MCRHICPTAPFCPPSRGHRTFCWNACCSLRRGLILACILPGGIFSVRRTYHASPMWMCTQSEQNYACELLSQRLRHASPCAPCAPEQQNSLYTRKAGVCFPWLYCTFTTLLSQASASCIHIRTFAGAAVFFPPSSLDLHTRTHSARVTSWMARREKRCPSAWTARRCTW